ncbi:COG3650 family protein [Novosphingobium lindaniclasticum]
MEVTRAALQRIALGLMSSIVLAGCHGGNHAKDMPGDADDHAPFHAISAEDHVRFTGTEPFWGGDVSGTRMTYSAPENPGGDVIEVSRFAGRGGLSFNGEAKGVQMTLAITAGSCSDGMSDRRYPFVAMLKIGEETRSGCAWTDRQPPIGGEGSAAGRP